MEKQKKRKNKIILDPGNTLLVLYVGFVLFFVFLAMVVDGNASITPSEIRQGELLFVDANETGKYVPAPHLSQNVEIYVSAMTGRTKLNQRFVNDTGTWQEAIYVFPLPDESAVDTLRMKIGERVIVGEIKEKEEARKVYEKARSEGKKASLLAQERPNIFTMAVANIAPGEEVEVEIEFSQVVGLRDGIFSLRFPMVITPRYIPGKRLQTETTEGSLQFKGTGWSVDTDLVPDASRITPPVAIDGNSQIDPVHLTLELAAGFPVARLESLYHGISVEDETKEIKRIRLNGEVKADRDFVLEWEAEKLQNPRAALFSEQRGQDKYLLLMLTPPALENGGSAPPRELIFVLDTSGSMAGSSIIQAREALILAISRLNETDRFNVIEFNSTASKLFDQEQRGDAEHRKQAIRFVSALQADGGTEIASALDLALDGRSNHERIRQVIFLTDGSVGNESELFARIKSRLGDSRLFTVGIGSAPNSFFMSRAATIGRGTFTYIAKVSEVQKKMTALFNKLERPAITDIRLTTTNGEEMESYPSPVPDLYQGEPLLVSAKVADGLESLQVSGMRNAQPWQKMISLENSHMRPGIATLWARKKIRTLMDSKINGVEEDEVKAKVLSTALAHHLVSDYTSLVAVEQRISRPADQDLHQSALQTNLPAGAQANKIFGGSARTATSAQLQILMGIIFILMALCIFRRQRGRNQ
jgi:Ca-activated chloride channel family protein